jgi:hypothetical protein
MGPRHAKTSKESALAIDPEKFFPFEQPVKYFQQPLGRVRFQDPAVDSQSLPRDVLEGIFKSYSAIRYLAAVRDCVSSGTR